MEPKLEVAVTKPRCPFCHENVEATDRKWGCPSCMAWHHAECYDEATNCAACDSDQTKNQVSGGQKLAAVIAKNLSQQPKANTRLLNLAKELRFLEKTLLEGLQAHLKTFVYPKHQGLAFESKVAPPEGYKKMGFEQSELFGSYHYLVRIKMHTPNVYEKTSPYSETYIEVPHYRSLHRVPATGSSASWPYQYTPEKDGPLFDLLQVEYFIIRNPKDPYNSGQNLPVIAYAEENYHFLIQLLHDLLLSEKMSKNKLTE